MTNSIAIKMKKLFALSLCFMAALTAASQAAFILPSPTAADEEITLYIDLNQQTYEGGTGGLKGRLLAYPEFADSVYLWTWNPSDADRPITNGNWDSSNEGMKMTHESGLLYSFTFIPTEFYNVDGPTFFNKGISCLAKMKNGNEFPDMPGEAKTEDFNIVIIPKLCDDLYCPFPQLGKTDDFLSITYDNNQETRPELQGMGPDDCYLHMRIEIDENQFFGINYVTPSAVTSTPALKMTPVDGLPGFFRLTILPDDFFADILPAGESILSIRFYALSGSFTYTGAAPFEPYVFLTCE